jgi:histidine phosphotransferase ChpT
LLEDPSAADMRADAMNLIEASAKKLVALLAFSRVAFGASTTAETFSTEDLRRLTEGVFGHIRAQLDWAVEVETLNKPASRALLNLAQIGGGALPTGGVAKISAVLQGAEILMSVEAEGPRARLRPELLQGLHGAALTEGLGPSLLSARPAARRRRTGRRSGRRGSGGAPRPLPCLNGRGRDKKAELSASDRTAP